jgi:hypothetical protein
LEEFPLGVVGGNNNAKLLNSCAFEHKAVVPLAHLQARRFILPYLMTVFPDEVKHIVEQSQVSPQTRLLEI